MSYLPLRSSKHYKLTKTMGALFPHGVPEMFLELIFIDIVERKNDRPSPHADIPYPYSIYKDDTGRKDM